MKPSGSSTFSSCVSTLNNAALKPALFVFGAGVVFAGTRPSRNAEELLAALHSKALGGNYRVAIISGDSGLSPLQVLNVVEASKLGPVLHTHMATGPASAATALLSLRDSSGVPFSEILLFARDRQLIEAALSAGIVCCKVTGKDIDADVLGSGLDLFGKRQLDEKGF